MDLSPLFYSALSLAGYVPVITATGAKSCRFAVPSLGPEAIGLEAAPFSKFSESARTILNSKTGWIHLLEKLIAIFDHAIRLIQKH
ncbi:hypothetical protein ACP3TB_19690 (plasmid) [Rahnella variigena]|uniref:hypothetical protein n=1 Tax=Rahnella variigena TaxID=574964 RepID=UPI003CE96718